MRNFTELLRNAIVIYNISKIKIKDVNNVIFGVQVVQIMNIIAHIAVEALD